MVISDAARGPLLMVLPILKWTGNLSFGWVLADDLRGRLLRRAVLLVVEADHPGGRRRGRAVGRAGERGPRRGEPDHADRRARARRRPHRRDEPARRARRRRRRRISSPCSPSSSSCAPGKRVEQTAQSRGLLAGLRFLAHDRLLGPILLAACGINLVAQGLLVAVQGLAYFDYSQDAHVVGYLFGAFGIGALIGAIVAQSLTQKVDLLKLAAVSIVLMPLPLWLLAMSLPWGAAMVVLACFGFFTPLVNAPIIGVLTVRTPPALRPKVMTAVMTVATLAGPLGFLAAGEALRYVSLSTLFVAIAAGLTVGGLVFAAVLLRNRDAPPASAPATA